MKYVIEVPEPTDGAFIDMFFGTDTLLVRYFIDMFEKSSDNGIYTKKLMLENYLRRCKHDQTCLIFFTDRNCPVKVLGHLEDYLKNQEFIDKDEMEL